MTPKDSTSFLEADSFEEMLSELNLDRRESIRISLQEKDEVRFHFAGKTYPIFDLSLGGVCFKDTQAWDKGWRLRGFLSLPGSDTPLQLSLIVRGSFGGNWVRCEFENPHPNDIAVVEAFIINKIELSP